MGKRFWSLALAVALVGGVFSALPAHAQAEPGATGGVVPASPNIVDDAGDANGYSALGAGAPPTVSLTGADVMAAWFTHDATNVYVHIQTETNARAEATTFQTNVGPAAGLDCIQLRMTTSGEGNESFSAINSTGDCGDVATTQFGPLLDEVGPEDTAILTGTFPRAGLSQLADGSLLAEPNILVGFWGHGNPAAGGSRIGTIDDTPVGADYSISSGPIAGGPGKPSEPTEPPGKGDPPGKGKKKGCGKGKGKQKGACPGKKPGKPKPPVASCPAYVPGEEGTEAETAIVTDAATEEKPVELDFDAPAGEGNDLGVGQYDGTASLYQNIQVDTQSADTGLYVRYEFQDRHDYDLYLNYPDGSTAANSGDFNVAPGEGLGSGAPEGGWEAGSNYEQVMGIRTADCAGYTARLVSFLTTGGATKLKIWLGPVVADPAAPGGGEMASDIFFNTLGMRNPMTADSAQASGTPAATKGCTKGKGKKKGCKKPPVASCAPYTPGELGAEQPTVTVTDAHTAEAPLLVPISLDAAVDEGVLEALDQGETPRAYFNVQVDGAAASAGLYATFEFQSHRDYDFWAYNPDGTGAASSHGFQPLIDTKGLPGNADQSNTASNHAGESTATSESIVGLITPDCGGYTFEASTYLGEGGDFEIKVWLGEGVTAPGVPE